MSGRLSLCMGLCLTLVGLLLLSAAPAGAATCGPAWNSATVYSAPNQQVSRTCGSTTQTYHNAFWTQNQDPCTNSGAAGSGQPWVPEGACGGAATATATTPPRARATATSTTPPARATATATTPPARATATSTTPPSGGGTCAAAWNAT